jgi:hypothetical protein
MKKLLLFAFGNLILSFSLLAQTKGLIISEILTNPSGNDSPFEYAELVGGF